MTPARSATTAAASAASLAALAVLLLTACGGDVSWCGSSGRDGGHVAIGYNTDPPRCPQPRREEVKEASLAALTAGLRISAAPLSPTPEPTSESAP